MSSDSTKPKGAPGWNDPPTFSYNSQVQGVQAAKLNLTKRVSFPASGSPSPSQPVLPAGSLPPLSPAVGTPPSTGPPLPSVPPPRLPDSDTCQLLEPDTQLPDVDFRQVYNNIESCLKDLTDINEKTLCDIKKRMNILESMWNENKFNNELKLKIFQLSKAIEDGNVSLGHELQRSLMVDHAALCSAWIPALRLLLNSLQSRQTS